MSNSDAELARSLERKHEDELLNSLIHSIFDPPQEMVDNQPLWHEFRVMMYTVLGGHEPGVTPDPFGPLIPLSEIPSSLFLRARDVISSYPPFALVPVADFDPGHRYHTPIYFQLRMCPWGRMFDMRWVCWAMVNEGKYWLEFCNVILEDKTSEELALHLGDPRWLQDTVAETKETVDRVVSGCVGLDS